MLSRLIAAVPAQGLVDPVVRNTMASLEQILTGSKATSVTDRTVKAAYAVLAKTVINFRPEFIDAPFPAPHTLAWYFGTMACLDEVRTLATSLKAPHTRVWSVAHGSTMEGDDQFEHDDFTTGAMGQALSGGFMRRPSLQKKRTGARSSNMAILPDYKEDWLILVQVLNAKNNDEAVASVEIETRAKRQRLKLHALKEIRAVDMTEYMGPLTAMLEQRAGAVLKRDGVGHWAEVVLERRLP